MPTATTHGESRVLEQAASGELVDLSELPEEERAVGAELLRRLCLETGEADPRGLRIKGASIQGRLDLAFCTLERPLELHEATFSEPPCFDNCSIPDLALRDCRLPGLEADELRVEFDLDLRGVEATGAIVLSGARIVGRLICDGATLANEGGSALDLAGAQIGGDGLLRNGFDATGGVLLLGAKVGGSLMCDGATLTNESGWALDAEVAEIGGGALLRNGFNATGGVRLFGAKVAVNLECVGATLTNESGWALDAAGAEIRGHALLGDAFNATGGVRLFGAKVGGSLMCDGATLANESGWALDAEVAEIGGGAYLRYGFRATGGVRLFAAKVGRNLECDGATLTNESGWALDAEVVEIGGGALLRNGFSATGGVRLFGAKVAVSLECVGATLTNESGWALDAAGAEVRGDVLLRDGFSATGGVFLLGAKVDGSLVCDGATLTNENGWALVGEIAEIGGGVLLRNGFSATGGVLLLGAKVGRNLECDGATLRNEGGWALVAEGAEIGGGVLLRNGFSATGGVRLFGAKVGVNLECAGATLANEDGWALDAEGADVGRAFMISSVNLAGGLNLFKLRCATLYDDIGPQSGLGSWAGGAPLVLAGFTYDRFGGDALAWDTDARFSWLRQTTNFDPGSWQRLLEVYRAHGQDDEARRTAIAMQNDRLERANLAPHRWLGRWILRVTIGHGYRPSLALLWAMAIVLPLALAVARASKGTFVSTEPGVDGSPQPVVYAVDTFLPIVDLGEADKWVATGSLQWAVWAVIVLGWIPHHHLRRRVHEDRADRLAAPASAARCRA